MLPTFPVTTRFTCGSASSHRALRRSAGLAFVQVAVSARWNQPTVSWQEYGGPPPVELQKRPLQHGWPDEQSVLIGRHMPVPPSAGGGGGGLMTSVAQNGRWLFSVASWNGNRKPGKLGS